MPNDTSVAAAAGGEVWNYYYPGPSNYGNLLAIKHTAGHRSRYAHLGSSLKANGADVSQGEEIAKSGNSGGPWCQEYNQQGECTRWASPYHLHFESRINAGDGNHLAGTAVDPYSSGDYLWSTNPPTLASHNTTVSLSASKIYSQLGKRVALTWSSTNATSVVSSNFGASSVSGSASLKPLRTTTYNITVNGPGGNASSQVTVNVSPLADFTRDTLSDLAAEYQPYGSWWVGVNTGGAFNSMNAWLYNQLIGTSVSILNGDYNGDGYMDIAARDISSGNWWVALNQGNNTFSTMQQVLSAQAGGTDYDVLGGDFNGDGLADFGVKYRPLGRWSVSINQGSLSFTSFWTWLDGQLGGNDSDTFSGDFNYDGFTDVGGRYRPSGGWWIANNQGNSSFGSMTQWLTNQGGGNDWDTLSADFNGDGYTDIGGLYRPNGDWWIGTNTQGSSFNSLNTWLTGQAGGTGWNTFYGYFNNDAYADIGGRYGAYGDWWIGLNTGSQFGSMTKWLANNAAGAGWNVINARSE
ncbi:MAG: VCBS repeat domain-containing M23 family metallopeptidase [Candidatus Berkelbacteria bacterium]|nr:MAG: VCBS repeat domain-containing M23 family metallopeptidase [Candidatus Berkelbacteria bacterium]QQG52140.1 MAG: VCBS repeat domain-containing M23 family metallopeptidase [Candidatus Berkelbacteria bacterium]